MEMTSTQPAQAIETQPGLRSIRDIIADLSKPLAERHLKTRKQGGHEITCIFLRIVNTKIIDREHRNY